MAVTSQNVVAQYAGNLSTSTPYAIDMERDKDEDLKLLLDGEEFTDFSISPDGFRTGVAVPSTSTLTLYRETPQTQEQPFPSNTTPAAENIRAGLDKLTLVDQEQSDALSRAPVFPVGTTKADLASTTVGYDSTGETIARSSEEEVQFLGIGDKVERAEAAAVQAVAAAEVFSGGVVTGASVKEISAQNYELTLFDNGSTLVLSNEALSTLTVPAGFPADYAVNVIRAAATPATIIGSGVSISGVLTFTCAGSGVSLFATGADTYRSESYLLPDTSSITPANSFITVTQDGLNFEVGLNFSILQLFLKLTSEATAYLDLIPQLDISRIGKISDAIRMLKGEAYNSNTSLTQQAWVTLPADVYTTARGIYFFGSDYQGANAAVPTDSRIYDAGPNSNHLRNVGSSNMVDFGDYYRFVAGVRFELENGIRLYDGGVYSALTSMVMTSDTSVALVFAEQYEAANPDRFSFFFRSANQEEVKSLAVDSSGTSQTPASTTDVSTHAFNDLTRPTFYDVVSMQDATPRQRIWVDGVNEGIKTVQLRTITDDIPFYIGDRDEGTNNPTVSNWARWFLFLPTDTTAFQDDIFANLTAIFDA